MGGLGGGGDSLLCLLLFPNFNDFFFSSRMVLCEQDKNEKNRNGVWSGVRGQWLIFTSPCMGSNMQLKLPKIIRPQAH